MNHYKVVRSILLLGNRTFLVLSLILLILVLSEWAEDCRLTLLVTISVIVLLLGTQIRDAHCISYLKYGIQSTLFLLPEFTENDIKYKPMYWCSDHGISSLP